MSQYKSYKDKKLNWQNNIFISKFDVSLILLFKLFLLLFSNYISYLFVTFYVSDKNIVLNFYFIKQNILKLKFIIATKTLFYLWNIFLMFHIQLNQIFNIISIYMDYILIHYILQLTIKYFHILSFKSQFMFLYNYMLVYYLTYSK